MKKHLTIKKDICNYVLQNKTKETGWKCKEGNIDFSDGMDEMMKK